MDELLSEKEQIEKIRTWWSDYGSTVIGGIVLGALGLYGVNYYQNLQLNAQIEASSLYDELATHIDGGNLEEAEIVADDLATNYANTSYAAQSMLTMASLYMQENRDENAADELRGLLALSGNEDLKHVARVRLAKILMYQGRADEVIALLESQTNAAFGARYSEALGDAYVASNRYDEARAAYRRALAETGGLPTVDQAFVQLKLLDVPDAVETTGVMPAAVEADTAEAETDDATQPATESAAGDAE